DARRLGPPDAAPGPQVCFLDWTRRRIYPLTMNQHPNEIMSDQTSPSTSRRQFLKASTTAALGSVFAANLSFPEKSFAANSDTLKVGLIGCGGRGNGAAADALAADSNTVLYAMGDIDPAKIELGLREVAKSVTDHSRIQVPAE